MGEIASSAFVLPTDLAELSTLELQVHALMALAPAFEDVEAVTYNIWLSVHELCVNIIKHAYDGAAGTIEVAMHLTDAPLAVEIVTRDQGQNVFDFVSWEAPDLEDPPIHGLGIFLIRQMMDVVEYAPAASDNRWRLVKFLTATDGALQQEAGIGRGA